MISTIRLFPLEALIEQLHDIYEKASITKAHLCTLSFGCIIAKAFANKYPDMVQTVTFVGGYICGVPSLSDQTLSQLIGIKAQSDYIEWLKLYASMLNPNKPFIAEDSEAIFLQYALHVPPDTLEKAIQLQRQFDSSAALAFMHMPVLWVMGEWDEIYKSTLYHLKQTVPHVQYIELEKAGHVAHIHQSDQFMFVYLSFLRDPYAQGLAQYERHESRSLTI